MMALPQAFPCTQEDVHGHGMQGKATGQKSNCPLGAIATERLHCVLRRMSDNDWTRFKALICERLVHLDCPTELDVLDRVFRKNENVGPHTGGVVIRMIQAIAGDPLLRDEIGKAHEHLRRRVRVVLREISGRDWSSFKDLMQRTLTQPTNDEDLRVLELVFRIGESISNVEIAALAKANRVSSRRLVDPEVASKNALVKARRPGAAGIEPDAAYAATERAIAMAKETAQRAQHTLAYSFVEPTAPYKHARNTVFRLVDAVVENQELMSVVINRETDLARVKPLTREQMRWALHRMSVRDRMCVIKMIPLNTVLMLQAAEEELGLNDASFRATRDRRLAYDLFVKGRSDEELMLRYRCSLPALKSAVAVILETLAGRPLARKPVNEYLERVETIEPMRTDEVRRAMKRLTAEKRAAIVNRIPPCAWKVRCVMPLHKRLLLDYLSGEWVLAALVTHYNLQGDERLSGTFKLKGTLTVRGADAAINGLLGKIAHEPDLRQQLRCWTSDVSTGEFPPPSALAEPEEPQVEDLMPVARASTM
jgi:hypothetical protein